MKLGVLEHKKNPLMRREEFLISIEHSGKPTPSRKDMLSGMVKELKTKESLILIDKIFNKTGKPASEAKVLVYKKPEDIPKYKLEKTKRRLEKEKKEKPAAPAEKPKEKQAGEKKEEEANKEEKPKEDKKEEKPEEKKESEEKKE
jgi:ribosomal protein S24E